MLTSFDKFGPPSSLSAKLFLINNSTKTVCKVGLKNKMQVVILNLRGSRFLRPFNFNLRSSDLETHLLFLPDNEPVYNVLHSNVVGGRTRPLKYGPPTECGGSSGPDIWN